MSGFSEELDDFLIRNFVYFNYKNYVRRIDLEGNEKVLEIGCGGGNLSRFLAERAKELVCIDNSGYWIVKAKKRLKRFKNIKFEMSDILDFNKEDYFDVAVLHYILHDIIKEKREEAIEILRKGLKKNGRICIREPIRKGHGIPSTEIRSLMSEAGFYEKISREGYYFPLKGKIYEGIFQNNNLAKTRHKRSNRKTIWQEADI